MRVAKDPSLPAPAGANQFFSRKHPDGQGCWTASREASRCHSGTDHRVSPLPVRNKGMSIKCLAARLRNRDLGRWSAHPTATCARHPAMRAGGAAEHRLDGRYGESGLDPELHPEHRGQYAEACRQRRRHGSVRPADSDPELAQHRAAPGQHTDPLTHVPFRRWAALRIVTLS